MNAHGVAGRPRCDPAGVRGVRRDMNHRSSACRARSRCCSGRSRSRRGIILIDPLVPIDLLGMARETLNAAALPDVLLDIVLGLMLFAASLHVDLTELERQKWTVLALASGQRDHCDDNIRRGDMGAVRSGGIAGAAGVVHGARRRAGAHRCRRRGRAAAPRAAAVIAEDRDLRRKPVQRRRRGS